MGDRHSVGLSLYPFIRINASVFDFTAPSGWRRAGGTESGMRAIVIGASADRSKFGNKAVRAYLKAGWEVVGVNPNAAGTEVEGVTVFETVGHVPQVEGGYDRALFYIPPRFGVNAVRKVAERGDVAEVWLNPGADGPEVIAAAEELGVPFVQACAIMDIGPMPR